MAVFAFYFIFFYVIHPLVPIDFDDWHYLSETRLALPLPYSWNPTRILPELLEPFCGYIAAYIIYPITSNYYGALIGVNAFVVSVAITIYALLFTRLMVIRYHRSSGESILLTVVFLLLHFMALRVGESGNQHLFYCYDVCCYYFYLIPNLLSASLVMSLMRDNWLMNNDFSYIKKGFLWLVIYFVICSNLFCSILFVAFLGAEMLMKWPGYSKSALLDWLNDYKKIIVIITAWIFVNLIELLGGRANDLLSRNDVSFFSGFLDAFSLIMYIQINKCFMFVTAFVVLLHLFLSIKKRVVYTQTTVLFLTFIIVLVYVVCLCSKTGASYILAARCLFPLFVCVFLFLFYNINIALDKWPGLVMSLPFLIVLIYSFTNQSSSTFLDLEERYFDGGKYSIEEFKKINQNMIDSIVIGAQNGNDSVHVIVPKFDYPYNWPFNANGNLYYFDINTLHKHGLISRKPKGRIVVSDELQQKKNDNMK